MPQTTTNPLTNPLVAEHQNTVWAMGYEYLQGFLTQLSAIPVQQPLNVSIAAPAMQRKGDTGVIGIRGILLKSVPAIYRLYGLNVTGYQDIVQQVTEAANDPSIKKIQLAIESPGGMVAGSQEAVDAIRAAGAIKPVTAVIDDLCCSGAYLLACAAGRIESNRNAQIGSIGVYCTFYDYSQMLEAEGIKTIVVSSAPHKGMGVFGAKITDEQIAAYKEIIDGMAAAFKAVVKQGRQMTDERLQSVSTGRVWLAPQAKSLGLIDTITETQSKSKSGDNTMPNEKSDTTLTTAGAGQAAAPATQAPPAVTPPAAASITELKNAFPNHLAFAVEQFEKGATLQSARAAFADVLTAENKTLQQQVKDAEAKAAAGSDGVTPLSAGGEGTGTGSGDFIGLAKVRAEEKKIPISQAMSQIASEQPHAYKAHLKACNAHKVKDGDDGE